MLIPQAIDSAVYFMSLMFYPLCVAYRNEQLELFAFDTLAINFVSTKTQESLLKQKAALLRDVRI